MIESKNEIKSTQFENVLGTPSAQKIICLLATWSKLSIKELISKSELSKSQTHNTLKNLQTIEVVTTQSRGFYSFAENTFVNLLKEAYQSKILEIINKEIYIIKQHLKRKELQKAEKKFLNLVNQYDPILNRNFPFIMSSIAHRFIEGYK